MAESGGARTTRERKPTPAKRARLDEAADRADRAKREGKWALCAHAAGEAMLAAHGARDYPRLGSLAALALEARRQARAAAAKARPLAELTTTAEIAIEPGTGGKKPTAGYYLLHAPGCVGVDGRALREACVRLGLATVVVVREPQTRDNLWPVVSVGPITIRARLEPPEKKPTIEWCDEALEALSAAALESVVGVDARERVDRLIERVETLPECEAIYERIAQECELAAKEAAEAAAKPAPARKKPQPIDDEW